MKTSIKYLYFLCICLAVLSSCHKKDPVEQGLEDLEGFVVKWESRSSNGIINTQDINEYHEDKKRLIKKVDRKIFENYPGWNEDY